MDAPTKPGSAGPEPDLASIVLGAARPAHRVSGAPESVPSWLERRDGRGYDARSVAILALVVATLAGIVGWATTIGDPEPISRADRTTETTREATSAGAAATTETSTGEAATADPTTPKAAAITPIDGIDLVPGRIVASRAGTGGGLVTVSVRNAGSDPAAAGAEVLVLMDGDVVGTQELGAIEPGAATRAEVSVGWCPAGAVALTAVVDPGAIVREANERDNSLSRSATFGC